MSDIEDCSETDRLYIALEPIDSPQSESAHTPSTTEKEEQTCTELSGPVTYDENNDLSSQNVIFSEGNTQTVTAQCNGNFFNQDGFGDDLAWNMTSPLQQNTQKALFRPFSHIDVPPLVRPYSPVYPVYVHQWNNPAYVHQSYNQPYMVSQSPSYQGNHLGPSIMNRSISDPDAEVSFYSFLPRDNNTPMPFNDRSSTATSVASSSDTPTDIDNLISDSEQSHVSETSATSRKRKRSGDDTELAYKRHDKPPYTYCGMIVTVIQNSPDKQLSLTEICEELSKSFEFFRGPYTGWRDSVRHNLSHNACFIKAELVSQKKNHYKWSVDLTRVRSTVFCIQRNIVGRTGEYKKHVHEQLELSPIQLPSGFTPGVSCRCNLPVRTVEGRIKTQEVTKSTEASTHKTHLRIPGIGQCGIQKDSPEVYRSRDSVNTTNIRTNCKDMPEYEAITPTKSSEQSHTTGDNQSRNSQAECVESEMDIDYIGIARYIMATTQTEGTSAAVANLSFLC